MTDRAREFRDLHCRGRFLILPNAWDAGSARLIQECGARAIATTSSGVAWSRGYPDGDALPPRVLATVVAEIARVIHVPLSVDIEGGYSCEPARVGEVVALVAEAGGVGINIEDGSGPVDLLCAKIAAARAAAQRCGVDIFINARTDVYLKALVPAPGAAQETIARARRYRDAGCDGLFVPRLTAREDIERIAEEVELPLNLMLVPGLPPLAELRALGVRRVSAGSALAQAAYGRAQRAARQLLEAERFDGLFEDGAAYADMNAMMTPATGRCACGRD